jgi:hypothetical protein
MFPTLALVSQLVHPYEEAVKQLRSKVRQVKRSSFGYLESSYEGIMMSENQVHPITIVSLCVPVNWG